MKKRIPILDFREDSLKISASLLESLSKIGFVAIKLPSQSASIIEKTFSITKRSLSSSDTLSKKTHHPRKGLSPYESENFACLLGKRRPNDRVVKFRYVNSEPKSELEMQMKSCFEEMKKISHRVLRLLAKALKLREDYWISSQENVSTLTANFYPCMEDDDEFDMQEHTDVDFITLVCSDEEGLEIEWCDGTWIKAPFGSDILILNVADALSEWPGLSGTFRSTKHRVKCASGSRGRISLAFFVAPHPNTKMCNPFTSVDGDASVDTITYKKWRRRRIARALKALKKN